MRVRWFLLPLAAALCLASAAYPQSWDAASSSMAVAVEWMEKEGVYTFVLSSPARAEFPVIAWSLQPFNLPQPASVVCPDGWVWESRGGWNRFAIADESAKYKVGGPGAEPGETLSFVYRPIEGAKPVNRGGPQDGSPAFLSHVGAVSGMDSGRWIPEQTPLGASPDTSQTSASMM